MRLTSLFLSICLVALLSVPAVLASSATNSLFQPNTQETLFLSCMQDSNFINTTANITIYNPDTTVFIENATTTQYETGRFNYTFTTPTTTGSYSAFLLCGTGATEFGGFQIQDTSEVLGLSDIATILALLALTATLFYLSFRHNSMQGLQKLLSPALHLSGIWSILLLLLYIDNNGVLGSMGSTLLFLGVVFIVIYSVLYLPITILTLIKKFMEEKITDAQVNINRITKGGGSIG